ncbi:MAG: amino acid adenylation domain-containing protein [Symplocastrum torsivum CPER-KK1]|jgi:amino acid adenylation domain-containing protein/non-ribosomal peptide synthase protein (TIGR01720 family)|uniref:Amino acid adenylation domain-containing protein n=1 Tax=Symplocastrum torsivum CPER-KK1 TaxID=450513 RepID=A0A951PG76_9CYAN|nr:amino acid adenylation domain-containing protein [Symplocastrum torsivum CPER-KK1]
MSSLKLSAKRRALLEVLLQEKGVDSSPIERISRRNSSDPVPLSFAQARLWFLDELMSGSPLFNISTALRLKGSLNVAAFEQSLNEIIKRHEALRTNVVKVDGQPFQAIAPTSTLTLPLVNLQEFSDVAREAEVLRLAREEAKRPFNLECDRLLRATLLRLNETEYIVLFTIHHLVSDDWSIGILIRELTALYEAFNHNHPSPLPELPIQYADFALWQQQWLQGDVLQNQLSYWKQQLGGHLPILQLPTDHPRPAVATFRGASQSFSLTAELTEALKVLSQKEDATLFMILLAAFKTLLYRYTGSEDVVVGSPIANRNRAEIEGLIGCFVNTLVLRTELSGNPTFRALLRRVREVTLGAYAHQDLPFEKLVEELQPERNLSYTPLFQVMFVMQDNVSMSALELSDLTWSPLTSNKDTTDFDLTLYVTEVRGELVGTLEYSTDLFDAATIARMAEHLQTLLSGIVANPEQRLFELPLLTATEQHQVLVAWNGTQTNYPQERCIHELFEAQVEHSPDAIAVVFEDEYLSYRELNQRANRVAHHLQKLGVKPEVLVGICVERSLEMVVGILGILKAGGAYLPLDPAYPQERLAFMMEDAQISLLLTQERLKEWLPENKTQVVCLDADWEVIHRESLENLVNSATSENLAYVIYTSGSTGQPKGVMIQHQSLVNYTQTASVEYSISSSERILQFASISFDAAAEEIFPCLAQGATLVLRTDSMLNSVPAFLQQCREKSITVLDLPTAFWHQLTVELSEKRLQLPDQLRLVIIGGERALPERLAMWQKQVGKRVQLVNSYGPTEATIVATMSNLSKMAEVDARLREVPIGRAIPNVQVYVLDPYLQPTPIGVPGELYIGGAGLARGYLNRPELTAEKFINIPLAQIQKTPPKAPPYQGEIKEGNSNSGKKSNLESSELEENSYSRRLYKTGDLARYLPSGEIELIGRIDDQVKIRGFRIELGEIEAVLSQHPGIRETVVVVREDEPGNKRLIAYVVLQPEQILTTTELRRFLEKKLPQYMLPTVFVMLDALPLLPSGKVARHALPDPDTGKSELEKTFVPPRTAVEKVLASIWSDVLRRELVGVEDNFFELGGDSILSLQIISKANQAGLKLAPKHLFQYQTIAELAEVAGTTQTPQAEQGLVTGVVPLTPIQHWFFEQDLPEPHHWNQAVLLELRQALNPEVLDKAVQHLLVHHDALRLCFERQASHWQQVNAGFVKSVSLTQVDLSALSESEQGAAIEAAAAQLQASLNLSEGSLVRVALFDLGANKPGRLLLVIHHLAVDGVSWRILLEDLQTAYQQLSRGESVHLPPKTTSFKDWAERLTQYAKSGTLEQELNYWLTESHTQVSPLPVDYLEGDNTEASARTLSVSLSAEETQALLQDVPQAYNTQINDVLLTALVQVFAQWTGSPSLLVDLEGHGREELFEDVDLSHTVGWFTTVFPILLNLEESSHPGEALKSVKEQLRCIPNRGIGYGLLRYLSDRTEITTKLRERPQAEILFNYLGQVDRVLSGSPLFLLANESSGTAHSLKGSRGYLLEVNGLVVKNQLQLHWTYSETIHKRVTVERLAESFVEALRSLIAHCQSSDAGGFTPSDFPLAQLGQDELDAVLGMVEFEGGAIR